MPAKTVSGVYKNGSQRKVMTRNAFIRTLRRKGDAPKWSKVRREKD